MADEPETLAAKHVRYFRQLVEKELMDRSEALEMTKHYIHAEALAEVMREREGADPDPPYPRPRKVD